MRVVLDTNIIISALLTPNRLADAILQACLKGKHAIVVNDNILSEYKNVMSRPKFSFSIQNINYIIEGLTRRSLSYLPNTHSEEAFPDESDRIFYETAVMANAILITGNKRHFPECSIVMSPKEFVEYAQSNPRQ